MLNMIVVVKRLADFEQGENRNGNKTCFITSRSIDPLSAILMGWAIPRSSSELFLLTLSPCLRELDRLNNISSETRRLLLLPRKVGCCGLSGKDKLLAFMDTSEGGLGAELRRWVNGICCISCCEQKLMLLFLLLLCLSNVFWAENGLGRTKYLKTHNFFII